MAIKSRDHTNTPEMEHLEGSLSAGEGLRGSCETFVAPEDDCIKTFKKLNDAMDYCENQAYCKVFSKDVARNERLFLGENPKFV